METLRTGVDCAVRFGAVLHAVHVVDSTDLIGSVSRQPRTSPEQRIAEAERVARHNLADALSAAKAPSDTRAVVVVSPRAADAILEYAMHARIDLMVIGRGRRNDVAALFLGSTAQQLVSRAPCPVLTIRTSAVG